MFGFLNINKPAGPTSHHIVAGVRRALPRGIKVGHAGTLDPFATGVLVVCLGQATRLAEYAQGQPKRYRATVALGATSTTEDPAGEISPNPDATPPTPAAVAQAAAAFVGKLQQVPPAHSAVHVNGERAYKLARRGETLDLPSRSVTIHAIDVLQYDWPELLIDVRCGAGTYIRSLARDLGQRLGVGGYCSALERTAVGAFTVDAAIPSDTPDLPAAVIDPLDVLDFPVVCLGEQATRLILNGRALDVARLDMPDAAEPPFAATDATGRLVAIATLAENGQAFKPLKVFIPSADNSP